MVPASLTSKACKRGSAARARNPKLSATAHLRSASSAQPHSTIFFAIQTNSAANFSAGTPPLKPPSPPFTLHPTTLHTLLLTILYNSLPSPSSPSPWSLSATFTSNCLNALPNADDKATRLTSRKEWTPSRWLSSIIFSVNDRTTSYFLELTGISFNAERSWERARPIAVSFRVSCVNLFCVLMAECS